MVFSKECKMTPQEAATSPDVLHFKSIPWCAAHLTSSPAVVAARSFSRRPKPNYTDALIAQTLNAPDAIPYYATFYTAPADPRALVTEVGAFLTLGPLVNGWRGVCHGGIVMTILDEVMGQLATVNKEREVMDDIPLMTAYLNTKFIKPVKTGTTIYVAAKFVKQEERKYWSEAEVQDENGNVLAKGEALFIMLRAKL
ncbi:HotDog domain-containing protein [Lasiosphaeria hispida]|uniref:HotDog domain-containing protein n=1 Tax=Lasiosphaeria hispida TaxID=260671 RepID=A0AAJ0HP39_9PEZI|nr:HotDog domain-containing protein [Lasiosphaeria hispida]